MLRVRIYGEAPRILCSQLQPGHGVRQTGVALHAPWRQRSFDAQLLSFLCEHVHMV